MQQKLFDIKPMRVTRPTAYTVNPEVIYSKIAERIVDWDNSIKIEEAIKDLKETFSIWELVNSDGYEISRSLERHCGYHPDSQLVEEADSFCWIVREIVDNAVKKWVADCQITPKFSVGNIVKFKSDNINQTNGVIKRIDFDKAEYIISLISEKDGSRGYVINFEDVEDDFFDPKHWS